MLFKNFGSIKIFLIFKLIKKQVKIIKENFNRRLNKKPILTHRRLRFIPNAAINLISCVITFALVGLILFILFRYLIMSFYHLH
jgi:hypothetical protein